MHWILDFDDTLALGPNTWAFQEVLPNLIKSHNLPFDAALYEEVMLTAQRRANEDEDEEMLLNYVFSSLNWDDSLKSQLIHRIYNEYQPALFPDTLAFLQTLQAHNQRVYLISNNNHADQLLKMLGIADVFTAVLSPKAHAAKAKPHRALFDVLQAQHDLRGEIVMVGDDPWSDGRFADTCGIACWIVDRLGRFNSLHASYPYQWATTLADIRVG
jgi:HAD superfamily hydrolase (TIGR01549 family)